MKKLKGFTLIELLVVIAIIGILTTLSMANFMSSRVRARDAARKSDLRQIQSALELYRADAGGYPASLPGCNTPFSNGSSIYMQKAPCDPTNTGSYVYTYSSPSPYTTYTIKACLENSADPQQDTKRDSSMSNTCSTGYSYTLIQP